MREISLDEDESADQLPYDTFLIYGPTRSGKTTFSAGFPRPLFLADKSEGGWKSLRKLADDQLFEPDVNPLVWEISEMNDVSTALQKIPPYIASGRVQTIVFSSITFYASTYLAHLNRTMAGDNRAIYGALAVHLREIRTRFHALGVNVVWEALADRPEGGSETQAAREGGPQIAGKSADTFAAGVTYLWRTQLDETRAKDGSIDRVLKLSTRTSGGYVAGSRMGKAGTQLPNPLLGGYKGFLQAQGYDIERLRRALPPIARVATTPKTAPKVAPPPSGAKTATTSK